MSNPYGQNPFTVDTSQDEAHRYQQDKASYDGYMQRLGDLDTKIHCAATRRALSSARSDMEHVDGHTRYLFSENHARQGTHSVRPNRVASIVDSYKKLLRDHTKWGDDLMWLTTEFDHGFAASETHPAQESMWITEANVNYHLENESSRQQARPKLDRCKATLDSMSATLNYLGSRVSYLTPDRYRA